MENWPDWVKHTLSIVCGLLVVGFVIWRLSPLLFFRFKAQKATGRITNWMSVKENGTVFFYPLIEYTTAAGQVVSYRANERCEGRPMYPVGTVVEVSYLPKDPKDTRTEYPEKKG